jgi:hypothetical protein
MNPLLCLILSLSFTTAIPASARETIKLTIRSDPQSPITRAGTRVMHELYKRLDYDVEISPQPLGRSSRSASKGETDGEVCRSLDVAKQYPELLKTDIPIVEVQFTAFGIKPQIKVSDWSSLAPYRLAYESGLRYVENRIKSVDPIPASSREQAFKLLFKERVDIVIMDRTSAIQTLDDLEAKHQSHPEVFELAMIENVPLYHLLNKRKKNLLPKVNHVLGQLQKEGFLQKNWLEETRGHKIQIRKVQDL